MSMQQTLTWETTRAVFVYKTQHWYGRVANTGCGPFNPSAPRGFGLVRFGLIDRRDLVCMAIGVGKTVSISRELAGSDLHYLWIDMRKNCRAAESVAQEMHIMVAIIRLGRYWTLLPLKSEGQALSLITVRSGLWQRLYVLWSRRSRNQ